MLLSLEAYKVLINEVNPPDNLADYLVYDFWELKNSKEFQDWVRERTDERIRGDLI